MSSILDVLAASLSPDTIGALSQKIGADEDSTHDAIGAALPLLVSALAANAARKEGATSLLNALERDHDGSILDDARNAVTSPATLTMGESILRHVLGGGRPAVEQGLSQASGLTKDQGSKLLALLAPLVLGALGKQSRNRSLDSGGFAEMLGMEGTKAREAMPEHGSIFASMLDLNRNGSVMDELGKMGMTVLGGILASRNNHDTGRA